MTEIDSHKAALKHKGADTMTTQDELVTPEQASMLSEAYRFFSTMEAKYIGDLAHTTIALHEQLVAANNAVRHTYRVLSDAEKQQMLELKDLGAAFIAKCNEIGKSRDLSLAVTNAEQAVMWAVKHVTA